MPIKLRYTLQSMSRFTSTTLLNSLVVIYDTSSVTPIDLPLRRTLVLSVILFSFVHPILIFVSICTFGPRQRGTMNTLFFYFYLRAKAWSKSLNSLFSFLLHYSIPLVLLSILLILMVQLLLLIHFACFET